MKKLSIISRSLSKIQHKRYELYVLSRIIHLLNDPGIKFNFQQCARRDEDSTKFALIDLYLPQFKIAIEVDEAYHKGQLTADEIRQREIEANIKPDKVIRIDCSKGIDGVNDQIDKCVNTIKEARKSVQYSEWDGKSGYEHYRNGSLQLDDDTELSSPTEICNIFGILNAPQRGSTVWYQEESKTSYRIWWPRENYEDSNGKISGDWYNKMIDDQKTIEEYCLKSQYKDDKGCCRNPREEHLGKVLKETKKYKRCRIVFYAKRNMLNERLYRYVGVFELNVEKSQSERKCIWERNEELSQKFVLPKLATINEDEALESLKEELQNCLNKLGEIKGKTDNWRTSFNQDNFDISSIECEINNPEFRNQKRNGLLTKLENLKTYINAYKTAMQKISGDIDVDHDDNSLDRSNKILSQIDAIYEDWCKRQTNIALLKPHILTLYKINLAGEEEKYHKYIESEILPEWIKLKTLEESDKKRRTGGV